MKALAPQEATERSDTIARGADAVVEELLQEAPSLLILGPRDSGKATTAARFARSLVRHDREAEAVAFRADPDADLAALEVPVLLDEGQLVPEVLGAVKRAVDADRAPGRYLITGAVHADLEAPKQAGTGRVLRLELGPMTVADRLQLRTRPFLDRVASGAALLPAREAVDLLGCVELALTSGFPQAVFAESFLAAHLRAEASYTSTRGHLHHLRTEQGRQEIELVAEFGGGQIVGIEVQATSAPNAKDAAHVAWLRDQLGARFVRGVVLHTGPRSFELGEPIAAAPLSAMWGPG